MERRDIDDDDDDIVVVVVAVARCALSLWLQTPRCDPWIRNRSRTIVLGHEAQHQCLQAPNASLLILNGRAGMPLNAVRGAMRGGFIVTDDGFDDDVGVWLGYGFG